MIIVAVIVGYLAGTVSFARIIGRWVAPDEDLSHTQFELDDGITLQFRGVSATAMAMRKGASSGCAVSILDMIKAATPVLAFRMLFPDTDLDLVAGVATIAGHNFPIWYRFLGGRGVSPLFGVMLVIDWMAIPVMLVASTIFGLVILADAYFAYSSAPLFLIPWFWWRFGWGPELAFAAVANVLYWVATVPELKEWIGYRRSHPRPRRERTREFRKGFAGMVIRERAD